MEVKVMKEPLLARYFYGTLVYIRLHNPLEIKHES